MDPMGTESTKIKMKPLRVAIFLPPSHLAHFGPCQRWHRFWTEGSITAQRSGLDPLRGHQGAMDSCASEQVEAQQRIFAMRYIDVDFERRKSIIDVDFEWRKSVDQFYCATLKNPTLFKCEFWFHSFHSFCSIFEHELYVMLRWCVKAAT